MSHQNATWDSYWTVMCLCQDSTGVFPGFQRQKHSDISQICAKNALNRISAIAPPKKRSKIDTRGRDRVELYHEIVAGLELAARH